MGVGKVEITTPNGVEVLIDLTKDSVTPETLAEGATAHNKSGEEIVGTMQVNKPTQFTNLYDPANVVLNTYMNASSSAGVTYTADNYCNYIKIPFHHVKNEPVVLRLRGIGTIRDRFASVVFASDGVTRVNHYSFYEGSYFDLSYDEYGDAMITFNGNIITGYEWYYFAFNFQYPCVNSKPSSAFTGPIITINEPIGNGGHA